MRLGLGLGLGGGALSAAPYVAPTVPVPLKAGYFIIGDDLVDATTWPTRKDIFGAGPPVLTSGTVNASGWPTPDGNRKTFACNGTTSFGRVTGLAAMATGDDPALEVVIWFKRTASNAGNTLIGFSNSTPGQTTPKRILSYLSSGNYRVTQQATVSSFGYSAQNTFQHMLRARWVNNGSGGNDITLWRNEELDPINVTGTLTNTVGAQAVTTFTFGAQDNGGTMANFLNGEIFAIWIRDPAAAPLTAAEGVELHNFVMGGYNTAPLYSGATPFLLMLNFGQSNSLAQGIATGAVTGLPDAAVKEMMRTPNNGVVDPVGLQSLDLRATLHGAQHYIRVGSFLKPHHMAGVGQGATNMGSSGWDSGVTAGPTPTLQGYYSTSLPSECRRNIFMAKARFGGLPSIQRTWWQGESDASAGPAVAANYAASLESVDTYLDRYIQQAFGAGAADSPMHVMKLNPAQTGGGIAPADLATVNTGIGTFAAAHPSYVYVLNWDDLTGGTYIQGDSLHATAAAMALIGPRFITSIKAADGTL